jgi:hypothetical protein
MKSIWSKSSESCARHRLSLGSSLVITLEPSQRCLRYTAWSTQTRRLVLTDRESKIALPLIREWHKIRTESAIGAYDHEDGAAAISARSSRRPSLPARKWTCQCYGKTLPKANGHCRLRLSRKTALKSDPRSRLAMAMSMMRFLSVFDFARSFRHLAHSCFCK